MNEFKLNDHLEYYLNLDENQFLELNIATAIVAMGWKVFAHDDGFVSAAYFAPKNNERLEPTYYLSVHPSYNDRIKIWSPTTNLLDTMRLIQHIGCSASWDIQINSEACKVKLNCWDSSDYEDGIVFKGLEKDFPILVCRAAIKGNWQRYLKYGKKE